MPKKITEFDIITNPPSNTNIIGVDFDSSPNRAILVPLSDIHKGITNGDFLSLTSQQFAYNTGLFIYITANSYTLEANADGKMLLFDNPYPSTLSLTNQRVGFSSSIIRLNEMVTVANNGTILNTTSNTYNVAVKYSAATLIEYSNNTYILLGDLGN
jgi:hypothetical protein